MNDEGAFAAGLVQKLIHARSHLTDSANGIFAMVQVPHVADDDGCFVCLPKNLLFAHSPKAGSVSDPVASFEGKRLSEGMLCKCQGTETNRNEK